ncbi:CobW family GTP-binding protein [Paenibacillus turpanensis]|uniref:CobW family GTP-binding protein n=1 Tax=Paenibacillus turpanensis TaxID=2689078 RepID=UPI001409752C|nr:CobW family GTP-binding protein [Paenibacillus turpanensis]
MNNSVPIIILSGFLGSGKTTLLTKLLEHYTKSGKRPALIMNEVGDVNLDGQLVEDSVPMREMLSGCICCSIRGDLGMEIQKLIEESDPDLIFIEATGVANPMEILDAVTEAALLVRIEIQATVAVVDAPHFLHWRGKGEGRTYRLMKDQIRCASLIVLNKTDCVQGEELQLLAQAAREINAHAFIRTTAFCEVDPALLELPFQKESLAMSTSETLQAPHQESKTACCHNDEKNHAKPHQHHDLEPKEHHHNHHHHSHDHVMVCTHYFEQPIEPSRLEEIIRKLPDNVYRGKGIFTSAETGERVLFQFAYRQVEFVTIRPQGNVQDVAVFMGEQFSRANLMADLESLVR